MGANSRRSGSDYVYGSAAPATVPVRKPYQEKEKRPAIDHTIRRNQEKALHMDLPYVVMLTFAAICALSICVSYLHIQSSITSRIYRIEGLEKNLEQLRSENDALQTRVNTYLDLDHVYNVATTELGMVYANKSQVLLYDRTESEYVRQYEDIPKH